jgi:hypothetical protein
MVSATSVWIAIGPALIAGGIGLASALMSFLTGRRSVDLSHADARENRRHQLDMLVWEHRLAAVESVWQLMFELEQSGSMSDPARDRLISSVIWLPDATGRKVLRLVVAFRTDPEADHRPALEDVRTSLLAVADATADLRWEMIQ